MGIYNVLKRKKMSDLIIILYQKP